MLTLRARFVVPVTAPPIENGMVVFEGERVLEVGPARKTNAEPCIDYENAVICPAFVNAHTHLELTHLARRVPPSVDFTDWLRRLMREVGAQTPDPSLVESAVREGVRQSLRAGVSVVGDITRHPRHTRNVLTASPLCGVSFGEIVAIGARRHLATSRLEAALDQTTAHATMRIGVSPHAPYTVEPPVLRAVAAHARRHRIPLCIHLAETPQEAEFTVHRRGPFVDYLRHLNVWDEHIPVCGVGPVRLAHETGLLTPQTVVAHANYVSDDDIRLLADAGAHVAWCPRTHAAFEHGPHRFRHMLEKGINVCIGTDSLASNPSLSILDELRFIHERHPDVPTETLMRLGTINGAVALGLADVAGSLAPGKRADAVVIPLDDEPDASWSAIFHSDVHPRVVYVAGRPVT